MPVFRRGDIPSCSPMSRPSGHPRRSVGTIRAGAHRDRTLTATTRPPHRGPVPADRVLARLTARSHDVPRSPRHDFRLCVCDSSQAAHSTMHKLAAARLQTRRKPRIEACKGALAFIFRSVMTGRAAASEMRFFAVSRGFLVPGRGRRGGLPKESAMVNKIVSGIILVARGLRPISRILGSGLKVASHGTVLVAYFWWT